MPTFDLTDFGPLETAPVELADVSDSVSIDIRFTDGLLWMPPSQRITLRASFSNQGNDQMSLQLTGAFISPAALVGGQLQLYDISLSVPFTNVVAPVIDVTPTRPITVDGNVRWVLPSLVTLLGVGELALRLGLDASATGVGFRLDLAAPVTIPNAFVEVTAGSVGLQVLPSAQAFELSLTATGSLTAEGRSRARSVLAPVFGPDDSLAELPSHVAFRRRFLLSSGAVPDLALPAGPALLDIVPVWSAGAAPPLILPLPDGLNLDIGLPELSLAFEEGSGAPTQFGGRLRNCAVHFPQLGALPAFSLAGALEIMQKDSQTVLRLLPSVPGSIDLPDFVRFFLSRLRWLAEASDLLQLPDEFALSLGELAWEQLFRGLLTAAGNVPDDGFAADFGSLLGDAIALLAPTTPVERVFLLAFSAFEDVADDTYEIVWATLIGLAGGPSAPDGVSDLVAGVLQLLSDAPTMLTAALQALFATPGLDLAALLASMIDIGLGLLDAPRDFLRLLMQLLAAAIGGSDPGVLARALIDLAVANDDASTSLSVAALLGAPSFFPLPDLTLPAVPALLMSALSGLVASIPDFVPRLPTGDSLYEVIRNISGALGEGLSALGLTELFDVNGMVKLLEAIIDYSEADLERELMLLRTSRIPILGAAVTIVAFVKAASRPLPWWDLMGVNPEHDLAYDTIVLPAPGTPNPDGSGTGRKYLIVSDVHRDKAADDRGFLNSGSIDHFAHNRDLYLRVLDWVDEGGYTIIEAGDSEELWYVRDFDAYEGPAAEMDQIIATHQVVYDKLRELQHKGRHVRIKGNHDSYLDQPAVRSRLDAAMGQASSPFPFEMYDFAIIHGVKTLQDAWYGGLDEMKGILAGTLTVDDYLDASMQRLRELMIGLDSTRYTDTKPMVVGHGHQWDFWNCRQNQLLGKMLSNLVGVPADQILDPFVDARGLAWVGEPAINFPAVASRMPVLNNWLATREAVKFAHRIQHQSSAERLLIDDVQFTETVTALSAMFGLEVDQPDDNGVHRGASDYNDPVERFAALRFNQLCIGHTHYPQAQPFWDIEALLDPIGILDAVRAVTRELFFGWEPSANFMRSLYYNAGTAGWHEGVVWGIEITELGQAQLVFWTDNSIEPERMDWQLSEMPPDKRAELDDRIDALQGELGALLQVFAGGTLGLASSAAVSAPLVAGAIVQSSGDVQFDIGALLGDVSITPEAVLGTLQSLFGQVVVTAALQGANTAPRRYTIRVPVPAGVGDPLEGVGNLLAQITGIDPTMIPKLACGWLQVVRNLPFFGGFESRRNTADIHERVFWVVVSLLIQLPSAQAHSSKLPLATEAAFDGDALVVTMRVG